MLTSIAALVAGLAKTLPSKYSNVILAVAGVLGAAVTALKFMEGSQRYDALLFSKNEAPLPTPPTDFSPEQEAEVSATPESAITPDPPASAS